MQGLRAGGGADQQELPAARLEEPAGARYELEKHSPRDHFLEKKISFPPVGDKESGKTTLIAKIQGNEDPKKGAGLEYCYVDVRDEYRDGERENEERERERKE